MMGDFSRGGVRGRYSFRFSWTPIRPYTLFLTHQPHGCPFALQTLARTGFDAASVTKWPVAGHRDAAFSASSGGTSGFFSTASVVLLNGESCGQHVLEGLLIQRQLGPACSHGVGAGRGPGWSAFIVVQVCPEKIGKLRRPQS